MDKIFIKDLEVYAFHGVHQGEKDLGQRFLISAELSIDLRNAGITDMLSETVNYAQLCNQIDTVFKKEKHDLIERAAEQLCEYILLSYDQVKAVKITIKKPWAPIGKMLQYAAIELIRSWHKVYIAYGSNMGNRQDNIEQAIEILEQNKRIKLIKNSEIYETDPVGMTDQNKFLNGALEIETLYNPSELMDFLLETEGRLNRVRDLKWGPRTIDLDILLYDESVISDEKTIIPHPRMEEREFVLEPLNEIAPYIVHPILKKRISQILKELKESESKNKY